MGFVCGRERESMPGKKMARLGRQRKENGPRKREESREEKGFGPKGKIQKKRIFEFHKLK